MLRIIGGKYRGKKLLVNEETTVPTKNRVREAIFDILGPGHEGESFLDLFAGSGAVGLEALSRGFASAHLVENNPKALRLLGDNAKSFAGSHVYPLTYIEALKKLRAEGLSFDVVFLDPPYAKREYYEEAAHLLIDEGLLKVGALMILEFEGEWPLPTPPSRLYSYGRTSLGLLAYNK